MSAAPILVAGARGQITAEVVSSLPMSYALAMDDAQVVVVDGDAGWPTRAHAAMVASVRGIVITDPVLAPVDDITALAAAAESADVTVLLSESWAGNPTVLAVGTQWASAIAAARTVESIISEPADGAATAELVLRQLRVLRRLGIGDVVARAASDTDHAYSRIGATNNGAAVMLFGVRSLGSEPSLEVVLTAPTETVTVRVTSSLSARPGSAKRLTPTTGEILPTIYETAHRATFIRMHELLAAGGSADELSAFAADAGVAQSGTSAEAPDDIG